MTIKKIMEQFRINLKEKGVKMPDMQFGSDPKYEETGDPEKDAEIAQNMYLNVLMAYKSQMDLGVEVLTVLSNKFKEYASQDPSAQEDPSTKNKKMSDRVSRAMGVQAPPVFEAEDITTRLAKIGKDNDIPKYRKPSKDKIKGWQKTDKGPKIVRTDIGDYEAPEDFKKGLPNADHPVVNKYLVHNIRTAGVDSEWRPKKDAVDAKKTANKERVKKGLPPIPLTKKDKEVPVAKDKYGIPYTEEELIDFTVMFEDKKDWYKDFAPIFQDIMGPLYREFFIALGITSQNTAVLHNFDRACDQFIYLLNHGQYKLNDFYDDNFKKANDAIKAGRFSENEWVYKLGDKIGNYTANILGDTEAVTIDLWMIRFLLGEPSGDISDKRKILLQDEVREIARALNWEPRQVQAAIWMGAKANWPDEVSGNDKGNQEVTDYISAMKFRSEKLQQVIDAISNTDFEPLKEEGGDSSLVGEETFKTKRGEVVDVYVYSTGRVAIKDSHGGVILDSVDQAMSVEKNNPEIVQWLQQFKNMEQ